MATLAFVHGVADVPRQAWNDLSGAENPFLRHEFLHTLEASGSVGEGTGWEPRLILAADDERLIGALPCYLKTHSRGEFVFDWAWADAAHRAGIAYYPKLVIAAPFSPVTGRRFLLHPDADHPRVAGLLLNGLRELADTVNASSIHWLFPRRAETRRLQREGYLIRRDCQYHWRQRGHQNFDDFLASLSSSRRKKIRRERRRVMEQNLVVETLRGDEIDAALWQTIHRFYASTYAMRGQSPYLREGFFAQLASCMGDALVVQLARRDGEPVAVSINLRGPDRLYGRYWGAAADFDALHFETCYYRGIDYCLDNDLRVFEPGAQGEYKLWRGFEPTITWSAHWLRHPSLAQAVADFLAEERIAVNNYRETAANHLPFRQPD